MNDDQINLTVLPESSEQLEANRLIARFELMLDEGAGAHEALVQIMRSDASNEAVRLLVGHFS